MVFHFGGYIPTTTPPSPRTDTMWKNDEWIESTRTGRELAELVRDTRYASHKALMDRVWSLDEPALRALLATAVVVLQVEGLFTRRRSLMAWWRRKTSPSELPPSAAITPPEHHPLASSPQAS